MRSIGWGSSHDALCKLIDIDIHSMEGTSRKQSHIWSYANLDDKLYFIDVTWGSPVFSNSSLTQLASYNISTSDMCYFDSFGMDIKELSKKHQWDKKRYKFE